MKYLHLRFPGFKLKTLTFSYDDGQVADSKLIEIFNTYNLKSTFNLNSELMNATSHINAKDYYSLISKTGHEVAVHGAKHIFLNDVQDDVMLREILVDRINLEKIFKRQVRGMAYAFGVYDDRVIENLKKCGINYSRTTNNTLNFELPTNWLALHPTCHHNDPKLMELLDKFIIFEPSKKIYWNNRPKMFYVWGHSYEFDRDNNWQVIEEFCKKASGLDDVWYATNGEIFDYCKAYQRLEFSAENTMVYNPSAMDVYINYFGRDILVKAGKTVKLSGAVYM